MSSGLAAGGKWATPLSWWELREFGGMAAQIAQIRELMVGTSYRQLQLKQGPKYSQVFPRSQEGCGEEQEAERCWWRVMV